MPDGRDISPAEPGLSPPRGHGRSRLEGPWRADAHAVVIGIDRYVDPKIPDLRFARADAEAVYAVLTDPEVGRFKPENVTLLVDSDATERRIRSALGTRLPRQAPRDSTVCIYYAGHGAPVVDATRKSADGIEKYLIPHDAVADDLRSSAISMDAVQQYFSYLDANQVVCFLDCCYSGAAGGRSFEREEFRTRAFLSDEFLDSLASEGRLVVTACATNEVSLESHERGHGLFTYHLVQGLRGAADTGGDGLVTIDELYDYVYQQVERDARAMGGSMNPVRKGSVQGRVYLTEYETATGKRIRIASLQASTAWERGDADEAERAWNEVVGLDAGHEPARAGLERIAERRAREQAAHDEAARRQAEELQRKHGVLLGFFENDELSPDEYHRALQLLDESPGALSPSDRSKRKLVDSLVAGSLTPKTYKQSMAALTRRPPAEHKAPLPPRATSGDPETDNRPAAVSPSAAPPATTEPREHAAGHHTDSSSGPRVKPVTVPVEPEAENTLAAGGLGTARPGQDGRTAVPRRWKVAAAAGGLTLLIALAMTYGSSDEQEAAQRNCDLGYPDHCFLLAEMYANGKGVARDDARAMALFHQACDLGTWTACDELGDRYARGLGVGRNDARAAESYQKSCDKQSRIGCHRLGSMYEDGRGVQKDHERAIGLYKLACEGFPNEAHNAATRFLPACEELKRLQAQ
jgi:uncharacterized caspase-like protein